jgi:hypothetical protein
MAETNFSHHPDYKNVGLCRQKFDAYGARYHKH